MVGSRIKNSLPWPQSLICSLGNLSIDLSNHRGESVLEKDLPRPLLGLLSSHDRKLGFADSAWQQSLLCALKLAKRQSWTVFFAADTPYAGAIEHSCKALGLPFLCLTIRNSSRLEECNGGLERIPLRDQAVAFLATRVFALRVRPRSKTLALLEARLSIEESLPASVYVAFSSNAHDQEPEQNLMRLGAVGWLITAGNSNTDISTCERSQHPWIQPISIPRRFLDRFGDRFLIHCTRARTGPWPDQSLSQFHDELSREPWQEQPESLTTLLRILSQQRLIATTQLRRSSIATICFSAQPWRSLETMRRYQSHLGRWDWEPYGIMVDRQWLQERGAMPVRYVNKQQARSMSDQELAFAQVVDNQSHSQDWTQEQEWRLANDLRLSQLPFSKGLVFVANKSDAKVVTPLARWPVVWLSDR
jgi:hypothetical protein